LIIEDLLLPDSRWREYASMPEMDPLTEDDALREAQLLDVRFDVLRSTAGLLFEMRGALQLREGNTGVLILHGVRTLAWAAETKEVTGPRAWTVDGSAVTSTDRIFGLELGFWPGAQLMLAAESAMFFIGDVPGLDLVPDYGEDDDLTISAQLASLQSEIEPVRAVFLDPAPPDRSAWPSAGGR
jgi:hypothetical protein